MPDKPPKTTKQPRKGERRGPQRRVRTLAVAMHRRTRGNRRVLPDRRRDTPALFSPKETALGGRRDALLEELRQLHQAYPDDAAVHLILSMLLLLEFREALESGTRQAAGRLARDVRTIVLTLPAMDAVTQELGAARRLLDRWQAAGGEE